MLRQAYTYAALLKSLRLSTVHFNDSDILAPLDSFACMQQVLLHILKESSNAYSKQFTTNT